MAKSKQTGGEGLSLESAPYIVLAIVISSIIKVTPQFGDDAILTFVLGVVLRAFVTLIAIIVIELIIAKIRR